MPRVTILMSTYNDAQHLCEAIDSVLAQDFLDYEFIIINDSSTDDSAKLLEGYAKRDARVYVHTNVSNKGLVTSLQYGLELASGDLIARIDSNDVWSHVGKLTAQVQWMDTHTECGLVGTWATALDSVTGKTMQWRAPVEDMDIRKSILLRNCFIHSCVMFRPTLVRKLGGYSSVQAHLEDYELWMRLGRHATLTNLPQYMVVYRVNDGGITYSNGVQQIRGAIKLAGLYKDVYDRYYLAFLKWHVQLIVILLFGNRVWIKFKSWFYVHKFKKD